MNILFVNAARNWGGVKTWMIDVAQGLRDLDHQIFFLGRPGPFTEKTQALKFPTNVSNFGMDFSPLLIIKNIIFCKKHHIDRVVVNTGKDIRTAGIAARILSIPVIHRVGLSGDMRPSWNVRFTQQYIKPYLLAPCHQIKRDMPKVIPFLSPHGIKVIHTGKRIASSSTQTKQAPFRCISTSQVNADKGHREVLLALSQLKQQGLDFRYDIVGTGREETALKNLAAELGLGPNVVWHGFQKDVTPFLRKADIFLLPSYREGLPNSLLEAMAQGLVCVARDVGGVQEAWPSWASSLLIPRNDSNQILLHNLRELLTKSSEKIHSLKQKFLKHAAKNFNLEIQVSLLAQWMEGLEPDIKNSRARNPYV